MQHRESERNELIETVYCNQCHLATPIWRRRCLHCNSPLLSLVEKKEAVEVAAEAAGGRR